MLIKNKKKQVIFMEKWKKVNKNNLPSRGVYCFDLDTAFLSASEASVHTGVCRTSIVKACRGQLCQAGGMSWCYSKDKDEKFPS